MGVEVLSWTPSMNMPRSKRRYSTALFALLFTAGLTPLGAQLPSPAQRPDPAKVVTAESCGECHISEYDVWKKTPHANGFKSLHRKESATAIAKKLGLRLIKRESRCLNCHYTPTLQEDQKRAVSGVSCESCHGAGQDWIDVHNDYGGKGFDHTTETPEHRAQRITRSEAAGMRRPSDLYPVAVNCYGCHTVPDEELVNKGGHTTGSATFELVDWSQGEIRHNFLQSFLTGDGTENVERGAPRKRLMYVVGRLVDLEFSLRGVAAATEEGVYLKAMLRRVRNAAAEVRTLQSLQAIPEVEQALTLVKKASIGLGQETALLDLADRIGQLTRTFLDQREGAQLAALDPLLDGTYEDPTALAEVETTAVASTASQSGVRKPSAHRALGPGACSGCHTLQNTWWFNDPHSTSVDPFFDQDPKNVEIARRYGLNADNMVRGTAYCMSCHGSTVSGRESRPVQDGVGCESCHGPSGDYIEIHREGEKSLGRERPGYVKALQVGMVELQDHRVRARACASCHYITDEQLLATGHPSGEAFDYAGGMAKVRHWDHELAAESVLASAFAAVQTERGPIPEVQLAAIPAPSPDLVAEPSTSASTASQDTATPATNTVPGPKIQPLEGRIKTSVHPPSEFNTVGPAACSSCHENPNARWREGPHYSAADPFFEDSPQHQKIARLYGLSTGQMTRGNQICMDCHGTIVTGKEKRPVQDGVGCESCHGPAAQFLEPHKEGEKSLGVERPGYVAALKLGMRELRAPEVRARTCTSCHLITEQRLIAAGHPAGVDFDYIRGLDTIKHWERGTDYAVMASAFETELSRRGVTASATGQAQAAATSSAGEPTVAPTPLRPRPDGSRGEVTSRSGEEPATELEPPSGPIEDQLLELKERLENLYRKVHPKGGS